MHLLFYSRHHSTGILLPPNVSGGWKQKNITREIDLGILLPVALLATVL